MPKEKEKFEFLDDDSKLLLESDLNAHSAYVDLLTCLNDMLISRGSIPMHSYFKKDEINEQLSHLIHAFSSGQLIGATARKNIEVANMLFKLAPLSKSSKSKPTPIQEAVDQFLKDVLEEYDTIRIIRSRGGVMVAE